MNALVTGGTGFLGKHIVERLVREGYRIRCVVRNQQKAEFLKSLGAELVVGDLTDPTICIHSVEGVDAVIHAAALIGGWGSSEEYERHNIITTRNILDAMYRWQVQRLIYVSSVAIYGMQPEKLLVENSLPWQEREPYCETKLACEELVRSYAAKNRMTATILRPAIIYGPHDSRFLPPIVQHIRRGTMMAIGKRNQGPPLVYVDDVTQFISIILPTQIASIEAYNLCSPEPVSWEEIIRQVGDRLGISVPVRRIPYRIAYSFGAILELLWKLFGATKPPLMTRFLAALIGLQYHFDSTKALSVSGFSGFTPFREALDKTMEWIEQEKSNLSNQ